MIKLRTVMLLRSVTLTRIALAALLLASCAKPAPVQPLTPPAAERFAALSAHSPPFARVPYEPFTRADAIAIAEDEWRLFGQHVDDNPPRPEAELTPADYPERAPGLWQRVGEYWWLGQNAGQPEDAWTGKHDENGAEFDRHEDGNYAWSAAFISYVMRTAGAAARFPYAPAHATYIDIGKQMKTGAATGWALVAEPLEDYAPVPGDLVCSWRAGRPISYQQLPVPHFASHCDIVVAREAGQITVIGGNVDNAVTLKHVPATADGKLADATGHVLDDRYPWFVALRILYER